MRATVTGTEIRLSSLPEAVPEIVGPSATAATVITIGTVCVSEADPSNVVADTESVMF